MSQSDICICIIIFYLLDMKFYCFNKFYYEKAFLSLSSKFSLLMPSLVFINFEKKFCLILRVGAGVGPSNV